MFSTTDTIVAIATPAGRGGIGVVRLSGPDAHAIARTLTRRPRPFRARHATFARVFDLPVHEPRPRARPTFSPADSGAIEMERPTFRSAEPNDSSALDQVVVTRFEGPHSFTGDDVVEISAHGSDVLLRRIMEIAVAAGARLAEPGEFTLRAYLNGRLDLVQAEAIADLVDAVTPLQARAAMDQLEGTLTAAIAAIDARLFDLSARLEASLDFPDEGFHFVTRGQAVDELAAIRESLAALVRDGRAGRVVRDGSLVVIAGRPNAGKSSLFNALVGAERAIVTDVPGTTRDLVTERVDMGGVPVTLVDTAGLRDAAEAIEIEGVRRAREAQEVAALTLLVLDGSAPLEPAALEASNGRPAGPRVVVVSKADQPSAWPMDVLGRDAAAAVRVSAATGTGLDALRARIVLELTSREEWRDPPAVSNIRHLGHLTNALAVVDRAVEAIAGGATEELVLAELGDARRSLEAITGRRAPDDLLRHIFSRFCVGK